MLSSHCRTRHSRRDFRGIIYKRTGEDKEFYSQFNGKDETNYKEIDAISGATLTTNGYKNAVAKALEAVKQMEGVA